MNTKILSVITAVSIFASGICVGNYSNAYQDGYDKGYTVGKAAAIQSEAVETNAITTTQAKAVTTTTETKSKKQRLDKPVLDAPEVWGDSIFLSWNDVDNADFYFVYRSTSENGEFKYIGSTDPAYWMDSDVSRGVRYYYKVKALPVQSSETYRSSLKSDWRSMKLPNASTYSDSSNSYTYEQTVYITNTGSKYHRYGCQYLRQSCISINKSDAISYGYTACSRCW